MANHLKMAERENIVALHRQGWSKRRIARELGVDRGTVRRLLRAMPQPHSGGVSPGVADEGAAESSKTPTPNEVLTGSEGAAEAKAPTPGQVLTGSDCAGAALAAARSKCEPYRELIEQKIEAGLSAQRIFQDLKEEHGFEGAYHSVQRMVLRLRVEQPLPFRRIECEPGAEAQADFGRGAPILGPDGNRRHSHVQRVALSFSRKGYSEAFFKQDTESWLAGWENAFWTWGGVPKTLQIDNTRSAVKHADWYDPEIHPIVTAFCKHYGTVLLPTKVRTPRHNGKVERNIGYVKDNALKGRTFPTLLAENEHLSHWENHVADLRIHGTTKKQVRQLFEIEKPALLPLPPERFTFFHEGKRLVHRDGHIEVAQSYYSAPPEYMGHVVWVRWDSHLVRILNTHFVEIRLHPRHEPGRFSTAQADISSKKIALVESGATALLRRVRLIGPQAARWAETVLKERSIAGVRVLVGLLALARRHSSWAVEQTCELACEHGVYHLRQLRALLKDPVTQEQFEFMAEHPLIRNLHDYGTLVNVHFGVENPWQEPALKPPEQPQQNDEMIEDRSRNGTAPALN
jgi:transposase